MKKLFLIIGLTTATLLSAQTTKPQTKAPVSMKLIDLGNSLMESCYNMKLTLSIYGDGDCMNTVGRRLKVSCDSLESRFNRAKDVAKLKLGAADFERLETQVKGYKQFVQIPTEDLTKDQVMSSKIWSSISIVTIEGLYLKLLK
jgi:hypothetical protein